MRADTGGSPALLLWGLASVREAALGVNIDDDDKTEDEVDEDDGARC